MRNIFEEIESAVRGFAGKVDERRDVREQAVRPPAARIADVSVVNLAPAKAGAEPPPKEIVLFSPNSNAQGL